MVHTYDRLPSLPPNQIRPVGVLPGQLTSQFVGRVAQTTSAMV
jgi:hypothetical protein